MIDIKVNELNTLENWYKEALILSSSLNPSKKLNREKVQFIYDTLLAFLGLKYFTIKPKADVPISKLSWIDSLLANYNHLGCFNALFEIAELLEYTKNLDQSVQKELVNLRRSPENLRTFFFELYIFKFLDDNNIPNEKKLQLKEQIVEGVCTILEKAYLFECRKVFLPNLQELDILKRTAIYVHRTSQKIRKPYGMICTISLSRPLKGEHLTNFENKIQTYIKELNAFDKGISKIEYLHQDDFGSFKAIDYDIATLIEIESAKEYDLLFYIVPPSNPSKDSPNRCSCHIEINFSLEENTIYKKLENVLREKKNQHKNAQYENKIIFIDSESYPEFQMGLFHSNDMFDSPKIQDLYNKLKLKDIVCFIRRENFTNNSQTKINFFYIEKHKETVAFLKSKLQK